MSVKDIFETLEYGPAPEGAEVALEWIKSKKGRFGQFIGGEWKQSSSHFPCYSPATGEEIAEISQGSEADVNLAVEAAKEALEPWQKLSGSERAKYLYAISRAVQRNSRLFAVLESLDNGKPIRETRDIDIPLVARHFLYHAGWATLRDEEFPGYKPVGVCGQIIPWNFPLLMLSWKIAPALAMGNTLVLKPAEFTPLTALLFAEICSEVGLPKGVVNIVTGDGETGRAIVAHPDTEKIAFTGSTEVGRIIRKQTAGTEKKLSLELGGKSAFIVFEDADIDAAVEGLVDAIWFNQGQVCCAGSRLLVQESIAEKVFLKVKARMETLRIGNPLDKTVDVGAIVDQVQLDRIRELVDKGVEEGAEIYQAPCKIPSKGWFYPPTLLSNVDAAATVAQVEIFGPVLVAMTFKTHAEAVALANNNVYGLACSVWTENINLAHEIAAKVQAGTVWVNCTNQFDASAGFGGYKESGYGREGGKEGLYEYLKSNTLYRGPDSVVEGLSHCLDNPVQEPGCEQPAIDRTHKLFIGGKQVRPDGGYTMKTKFGEVAVGNRKDIRNAVEASDAALKGWSEATGHLRSQILYYLAENLAADQDRFLRAGASDSEVSSSIEVLLTCAAYADKFDGAVHQVPMLGFVYTRNEAIGNVGLICPDNAPLLGLIYFLAPLIAMGNTVTVIPSETNPVPACELYRVLEASDIPSGVINIVTGAKSDLVKTLAQHDNLQAVWCMSKEGSHEVLSGSVGNLKRTLTSHAKMIAYDHRATRDLLREAVQVKNIWIPYGA